MMLPELEPYASLTVSVTERIDQDKEDRLKRRIEIVFIDLSRLVVNEITYFDTNYLRYGYQWLTADNQLLIRWDNAEHHNHIETFPHHRHVGSEENVQPSDPMTLEKVLVFIASQLNAD
ncbi:toxin-antitoxin system TumE family protein [Spirosoma montaniterrae]|uniref:Uncharacterized protein n=1 Tax=Spirosoma montaniterrae TaxID=1178516 RepID=A0A1P9WT57_9BACT|nr:DUF6516 family protein [Spirosoma montaniterrae]AQG78565.1 hypothetical protein AWR27_03930 [Spirosoma montaniterrae]